MSIELIKWAVSLTAHFSHIMYLLYKHQIPFMCQVQYWGNTGKQGRLGSGPVSSYSRWAEDFKQEMALNFTLKTAQCFSSTGQRQLFCSFSKRAIIGFFFLEILELKGNLDLVQFLIEIWKHSDLGRWCDFPKMAQWTTGMLGVEHQSSDSYLCMTRDRGTKQDHCPESTHSANYYSALCHLCAICWDYSEWRR